ncbi:hypothetical protein N0V90_007451 [Kalmusia sp. IMI 367209]|nr:hypothetical protein N0V90_007451 [Kalmusia sp. IMI 367209]
MSDFNFEPFQDARSEFRLLTIYPGSPREPLTCELNIFSVASLPDYEALSYTWGDNDVYNTIQINNKNFVTFRNAHNALFELRDPFAYRVIWIDAICINQRDLEEKRHQILLMKIIYENASRVIVWFSQPRGNADLALGLLNELHVQLAEGTHNVQSMLDIHYPRLRLPEWIAIRDFLDHPWWSRIWTLQEAVVGREIVIQFGRHTIPWEKVLILGDNNTLLNGMFFKEPGEAMHSSASQPSGCSAIPIIQWIRSNLEAGRSFLLLELLLQCWWREATDSRDCIYALSALSSDIHSLGLRVDYTAPVEEVLKNVVNKILLEYGTLELFSKAGCGFRRNLTGLPSYVPDWSDMQVTAQPLYWHFYKGPRTVPPDERGVSLHRNGRLQMRLFYLDSIKEVSEPLCKTKAADGDDQVLSWFDAAERMAAAGVQDLYPMTTPSLPSVSLFEAFWRTMTANRTIQRVQCPQDWYHGYLRYKHTLSRQCGSVPASIFKNLEDYEDQYDDPMHCTAATMMDWFYMMLVTSWERSFCVTHGGMIGLVPPGALPGDRVCLLLGGSVPFVMRPKAISGSIQELELVGESYFHGVMAIDGLKAFQNDGKEADTVFLV